MSILIGIVFVLFCIVISLIVGGMILRISCVLCGVAEPTFSEAFWYTFILAFFGLAPSFAVRLLFHALYRGEAVYEQAAYLPIGYAAGLLIQAIGLTVLLDVDIFRATRIVLVQTVIAAVIVILLVLIFNQALAHY